MGKYSNFDRIPRDYYKTPFAAVTPLIPHLEEVQTYVEPCAGDGQLVNLLSDGGFECIAAYDIEPQEEWIVQKDALSLTSVDMKGADVIITNPPWTRPTLHAFLSHFVCELNMPTWLLFDAGWVHTKQSIPYQPLLRRIVSVGRVKWIEGTKMTGKEDCAWHLFTYQKTPNATKFYGRI